MTKQAALPGSPAWTRYAGQFGLPLALIVGASWLTLEVGAPKDLWAGNSVNRVDSDGDGITDLQESVLGTSPDHTDTDGDGFSDLEELARNSDPNSSLEIPQVGELDVGMYAHSREGWVHLSTAIFIRGGTMAGLNFDIGIFFEGQPVVLGRKVYGRSTNTFLYDSVTDPENRIVVHEMIVPESLVRLLQKLDVFARVEDLGPQDRGSTAYVTELQDFSGVTMMVDDAPAGMGPGVIYQPLAPDHDIPSDWSSGRVCWQSTVPVGTNGSNIVYEVDAAECRDLDSYCSPSDCQASVGTAQERPDPGSLIGG